MACQKADDVVRSHRFHSAVTRLRQALHVIPINAVRLQFCNVVERSNNLLMDKNFERMVNLLEAGMAAANVWQLWRTQ